MCKISTAKLLSDKCIKHIVLIKPEEFLTYHANTLGYFLYYGHISIAGRL